MTQFDVSNTITIKHPAAALFVARKLGLSLEITTDGFKFRTSLTTAQALSGYASSRIKHDYEMIRSLATDLRIANKK